KRLTDKYNSITIPDYLASHFKSQSKTIRIISASALCLFVTIYVSAQIDATGKAFESFLEWNYFIGAIVGFFIVAVYITSGGFVAVAWSDLFQGLVMLLGLLLLPFVALNTTAGEGGEGFIQGIRKIDPVLLSLWGEGGLTLKNLLTVVGLIAIGIGFMGSPQIFVRFISIKDEENINQGRWIAIAYTLLATVSAVFIGMIGRYIFTETGQDPEKVLGSGADRVLPMLVEETMPLIIVSVYIAAVLSAIMSTIDSLLVVASSAVTRDFYQQLLHPEQKEEKLGSLSRKVTITLALIALAIAMSVAILSPSRTVFWFVIFGWSGIAATFCPVMILSLFWKRYNSNGALASMISGFACVPIFKFLIPNIPKIGAYFSELGELFPSFMISLLVRITISLLSSKRK
ncbi:MAG: sodium/proline symporter, partial [Flavobacteriales bacterium]